MKTEFYKDASKQWRWRIVARNGKIRADSGQGYSRKIDCIADMEAVTNAKLLQAIKNDLQNLVNAIASSQDGKVR